MDDSTLDHEVEIKNLKADLLTTQELVQKLEKQRDIQEQQIAHLTLGFSEMGVMVESLVAQLIFENDEPHVKDAFTSRIDKNRKLMYEKLNEIAKGNAG